MLKNKWFWSAVIAAALIITVIIICFSCSQSGGAVSEDGGELSVGGEDSYFTEPSAPDFSFAVSNNDISEESITEYSDYTQESSTETSGYFPEQSTTVSEDNSKEDSSAPEVSVPEVSVSEPVLITLPVITTPNDFSLPWDGNSAKGFERGSGTQNDPYIISTPSQLAFFRDTVNSGNSFAGEYVRLEANLFITDITAETPIEWKSIGNAKNPFCGTFDGGGHVIGGLYGGGLFGYIRGSVKNIGITDSYITHGGGIADIASKDFDSDIIPVISGCFITHSTVEGSGGIATYTGGYSIIGCVNDADIIGTDDWVGGVVGQVAMGSMKNCFNLGTVQTESFCGGVVGNAFNSTYENCYNIGEILCTTEHGSFAAVSYDAVFIDCGVLEGTAENILYLSDISPQTEAEGIQVLTKDQFR